MFFTHHSLLITHHFGSTLAAALQKDRVVVAAQLVARLQEERLRDEVLLVDERADSRRAPQKRAAQLRQAAQALAPLSARVLDVDALDVDAVGRVRRDVGLEDELSPLDQNPHAPMLDAARAA